MSEPQNPLPPVRLPEHIIAQLRWLIDNPWHVGAAAALADELTTWVATSPGSRPLDDFFDALKCSGATSTVISHISWYFAERRPPVVDWDGLLAIDMAEFVKEPGIGKWTTYALMSAVARCGVMPPPKWVRVAEKYYGPGWGSFFERDVKKARAAANLP